MWSRKDISIQLKLRLYYALLIPIAVYVNETWTILKKDERRLNVFEMKCFRSILGITLQEHVRNELIKQALNVEKLLLTLFVKSECSGLVMSVV